MNHHADSLRTVAPVTGIEDRTEHDAAQPNKSNGRRIRTDGGRDPGSLEARLSGSRKQAELARARAAERDDLVDGLQDEIEDVVDRLDRLVDAVEQNAVAGEV